MVSDPEVTSLLKAWHEGDSDALAQLLPIVLQDLRGMARRHLARESPDHTLQPTDLVHEVFLRLLDQRQAEWTNRAQFFGIAARLMRWVLVDHARRRQADKRGGQWAFAPLEEALETAANRDVNLVALDDALNDLANIDPAGCRVIELRFFVGLTHEDIASIDDVPVMTVRRRWMAARAWLFRELNRRKPR